ncbi:MAG: hypothetical protein ACOC84_00780 [Actinomycetota bacterium]
MDENEARRLYAEVNHHPLSATAGLWRGVGRCWRGYLTNERAFQEALNPRNVVQAWSGQPFALPKEALDEVWDRLYVSLLNYLGMHYALTELTECLVKDQQRPDLLDPYRERLKTVVTSSPHSLALRQTRNHVTHNADAPLVLVMHWLSPTTYRPAVYLDSQELLRIRTGAPRAARELWEASERFDIGATAQTFTDSARDVMTALVDFTPVALRRLFDESEELKTGVAEIFGD